MVPTFGRDVLPLYRGWKWYPSVSAHGVISQKITFLIFAAVITSNLTDDEFAFYDSCVKLKAETS
jgi:hypothetical protein